MNKNLMNWSNLKKNRCPQCSKDWSFTIQKDGYGGLVHNCGFKIRETRYQEIVSDRVSQEIENNVRGGDEKSDDI